MLKRIKIITLILLLSLTNGCAFNDVEIKDEQLVKTSYTFETMADKDGNMVLPLNATITLITTEESKKEEMRNITWEIIQNYQKLLDPSHYYDDINNICVVNDNYGSDPIKVDSLLIEILESAIKLSKNTNGYFNPTLGTVSDIWKDKFTSEHKNTDPDKDDVENAVACVIGYEELDEYIVIDKQNSTIQLKQYPSCNETVKIDLGAYAKGYVLDKVYEALVSFDSGFLISAGGSSIVTHVPERCMDKLNWSIGVKSPNTLEQCYVFKVKTSFISTSGDEQQYFINEDDIRRHHILNPYTGYSENNYRNITLVADSNAGLLDGLTTALFNIEDDIQNEIITNIENLYGIDIKKAFIKEDSNLNLVLYPDSQMMNLIQPNLISKEITVIE